MKPYPPEFRQGAKAAAEINGVTAAAQAYNISPTTLRRWMDPAFADKERSRSRQYKQVPCRKCGKPCSTAPRKRDDLVGLCRACINRLMADEARGVSLQEIIRMYEDGLSTNEIAFQTNRSQSGVYALLKNNGVRLRSRAEGIAIRKGGKPQHRGITKEKIQGMLDGGMSRNRVARELGVSNNTVTYHLAKEWK